MRKYTCYKVYSQDIFVSVRLRKKYSFIRFGGTWYPDLRCNIFDVTKCGIFGLVLLAAIASLIKICANRYCKNTVITVQIFVWFTVGVHSNCFDDHFCYHSHNNNICQTIELTRGTTQCEKCIAWYTLQTLTIIYCKVWI